MKIAIVTIIVVVIVAIALIVIVQRRKPTTQLTQNEATIRDLVREVYATKIVTERVTRDGADAVLVVEVQNEKLKQLQINLSSLARKHEEGASLAALKASLRFD
jgi:flagellar basal body-associated protein FliL